MAKIEDFIKRIENIDISFFRIAFLLYGIMFIRTFLENYANSYNSYIMAGIIDTFFSFPAFYFMIILLSSIVVRIITKEKIEKIAKFIALCSFGLLSPPIIDLIVNKSHQASYNFIGGDYPSLLKAFFTYFSNGTMTSIGLKIEIAIALIGLGFYIFYKTKKIRHTMAGILILYLAFFVAFASPALIFGLHNTITKEYQSVNKTTLSDFYYNKEPSSAVTSGRTFIISYNSSYTQEQAAQKTQNQYSTTLSIVFLLIDAILFLWCLFLYSSKKFFVILKNFRFLRIIHNSIVIFLGIFLGVCFSGKNPIGSLFDLMSFVSLFLSFFFAWLFAVWENDEADIQIDKISNQTRPLVGHESVVSDKEWQILKYVFLVFSLGFAFLDGLYFFVFMLLFIFIYHIYSTPPFRFKRFIGISSLLIAVCTLLLVLMGFFMSSGTENLSAFPTRYMFGLLGIFFLVENGKNTKDTEGDKRAGIKTLPVLLGEKWGKLAVGACVFLGALLVPFVFYLNLYTFLSAVFFGMLLFLLTIKDKYQEKYLFISYYIYVVLFLILITL